MLVGVSRYSASKLSGSEFVCFLGEGVGQEKKRELAALPHKFTEMSPLKKSAGNAKPESLFGGQDKKNDMVVVES